ncbi:MAG: type II toxin-antitoxin system prevent-host-death family antitoxin [Thermoleophilia bacterium]|nr:type II toxin-antitoxin system prevent-host-death family antitoxin [Thermoleophilia bacterium]
MVRIGIRELRDNLTAAVRRVRAGETIEITHDGEPVAIMTALPRRRLDRLVIVGDATPPIPLDTPLCRFPVVTGRTASQALEDDRTGS